MKLSALHIARWVEEARSELLDSRIDALHKDEHARRIVIDLYSKELLQLVFLFLPGESLLYFTSEAAERAGRTTNFLPQLVGARIMSIEQISFDRIVDIKLTDGHAAHNLVFELFGPKCNLYLLSTGDQIVTSLRTADTRDIYSPPRLPAGLPPTIASQAEVSRLSTSVEAPSVMSLLKSAVRGCDGTFWDIVPISNNVTADTIMPNTVEQLLREAEHTAKDCITGRIGLTFKEGELRWSQAGGKSLNSLLSERAEELTRAAATNAIRLRLSNVLRQRTKHLCDKLDKLRRGLAEAEDADKYRIWAELLTINIKRIRRGMTVIAVANLYAEDQPEIAIPLSEELSPSANIQRLFKKAKKLKDSVESTNRLISETEQSLRDSNARHDELDRCANLISLLRLERSLIKDGLLKRQQREKSSHRAADEPAFAPRSFLTSAGETVLVGRNARENEFVTFTAAKKHDYWFHSQQTSGSHIILKLSDKNKPPSQRSVIEAAQIAAHFSQARTSAKVPVIYTEVRHLQKIKGATPGLVKYTRVSSIMVEPILPKE
jgi:predicted ribosome quality control (RQC) complex YloA/Tae2 family protein